MTGRWLVLSVRVPSEELTAELAEGLVTLGGSAVEDDAGFLTTYVPEPAEPEAFRRLAADRMRDIAGAEPEISWRWLDDEDWSRRWKEGLAPRRVGERVMVTQPWNPVEETGDRIVVVVEPASAFGTGEHATTRGALRLLERALVAGDRVLDVGTGTGILAMVAIRMGAAGVLAVEADGGAIDVALESLERNGVAHAIELVHAEVDAPWLAAHPGPGFDLIVANVLSGVLVPLLPAFRAALAPAGRVILAGILETESAGVRRAATAAGLIPEREDVEEEWWSALFRAAS